MMRMQFCVIADIQIEELFVVFVDISAGRVVFSLRSRIRRAVRENLSGDYIEDPEIGVGTRHNQSCGRRKTDS